MNAQEITVPNSSEPAKDAATTPKRVDTVAGVTPPPAANDAGTPAPAAAAAPNATPLPPAPPVSKFTQENRIHVEHGSLFDSPYLVVHPRELAPEREETLRKKLDLTYSIASPSFFEDERRMILSLQMGQYLPIPLDAKRSLLMESIKQFNEEATSGQDTSLKQQA
jgi:hypothetical protein